MITHRIVEHLKRQHWTAVLIEIVIVVIGVFIGLQANNWSEQRRDRMRERTYLTSIAAELDESIQSIENSIAVMRERMALDELLIESATDPGRVRAEPGRFIYAITRGGYTFSPGIHGFTFEEIKSAGDLGLISDATLALDLMKFYANVEAGAQWGYLRSLNQSEYIKRSAGILTTQQLMLAPASTHVVPTVSVEDALEARKRMLDHPDFIAWVPTVLFFRTSDLDTYEAWLESAKQLRARILAQPGVRAPEAAPGPGAG